MDDYFKKATKEALADLVDARANEPDFQKGIIAGQHMKECEACHAKLREFERMILGEIYEHAMESQK